MLVPAEILNLITRITDIQSRQALLALTIRRCEHPEHQPQLLRQITKLSLEAMQAHEDLLVLLELFSPSDVIIWPKLI